MEAEVPNYYSSNKKIKSWNRNFTAVLNAVNKAKQKAQWSYAIASLGGAIALATMIAAIVVQTKYETVGKVMQMLHQQFLTVTQITAAHEEMAFSVVSDLAD
jgi:hypothetical protein